MHEWFISSFSNNVAVTAEKVSFYLSTCILLTPFAMLHTFGALCSMEELNNLRGKK